MNNSIPSAISKASYSASLISTYTETSSGIASEQAMNPSYTAWEDTSGKTSIARLERSYSKVPRTVCRNRKFYGTPVQQ